MNLVVTMSVSDDPSLLFQASAPGSVSLGTPYNYKEVRTRHRPAPKTAYGFLLNPECHRRWSRWYCELVYKDKLAKMSPQEAEEYANGMEPTAMSMLPGLIYSEFPTLPRLRNRALPVKDGHPVPQHYVFVLRDDATWEGMKARLDPEVVDAVGRRLGVPGQKPGWYLIDLYVHFWHPSPISTYEFHQWC